MYKLKEIYRNGVIAWSPFELHHEGSHMLAIGTAAGSFDIDFNTNNRLEILSTTQNATSDFTTLFSTETKHGFTTLSWAPSPTHSTLGLLAGGTPEGLVNIYDPAAIRSATSSTQDAGLVTTVPMSDKSAITSLDFCPSQPNLLAIGNGHGSVVVTDLTDPSKATHFDYKQRTTTQSSTPTLSMNGTNNAMNGNNGGINGLEDQISCVLWNRRVAPIIATLSGTTGTVTIWDMRKKMAIISFNDNSQGRVAAWRGAAWDPAEPTVLATVCDNDSHPVVLWDLRSIQVPRYYTGHTRGVSSISWSALDPSLVVTTGRDRTLCWNPATLETRFEVDSALPCRASSGASAEASEGGSGESAAPGSQTPGTAGLGSPSLLGIVPEAAAMGGEQRWDSKALWSPHVPGALAICTFGAHKPKVSVMGVHDPVTAVPPAWMKKRAGAAFCAGNMLARFAAVGAGATGKAQKSTVEIRKLDADRKLAERAERFQETVKSGGLRKVCTEKMESAKSDEERDLWGTLSAHFGENVRAELQKVLGYDADKIAQELSSALALPKKAEEDKEIVEEKKEEVEEEEKKVDQEDSLFSGEKGDEEDAFSSIIDAKKSDIKEEKETIKKDTEVAAVVKVATEGEDGVVTRALLLGRFDEAVDYCFSVGRDADALLIASYGSREQFERARAKYTEKRLTTPEMRFVALLARASLQEVVAAVAVEHWRAALAAICTYADRDAFPVHAAALGRRLEAAGNTRAAAICFVAAGDVERVVDMWLREQDHAAAAPEALATLVEDLAVLVHGVAMETAALPERARAKFVEYAKILEANGFPATAARYVEFLNTPANSGTPYAIFLDRLYKTACDPALVLKAIPFSAPRPQTQQQQQHSQMYGKKPFIPQQQPQQSQQGVSGIVPKPANVNPFTHQPIPSPSTAATVGAPAQPNKIKMMNIAPAQPAIQQAAPKPSASAAFMKPAIPTIPTKPAVPAAAPTATATTQTTIASNYARPQVPQVSPSLKMFTPAIPTQPNAPTPTTTTATSATAAAAPTHSASALFANVAIPKPASTPTKRAGTALAAPATPAQGMFIPKAPAPQATVPHTVTPTAPTAAPAIPTVAGSMGAVTQGIPAAPAVIPPAGSGVVPQPMLYGGGGSSSSSSGGAPQVAPTSAHAATKALTVPLAETVQEHKPADQEKVEYIRGIIRNTVPGMERAAAGTQHVAHVKEMVDKLSTLDVNVDKYEGPVVDALYEVFGAVLAQNWAAADAAFAGLIKNHGSQLKNGIPVGVRFFMRLYKILPH